MIKYDWSRMGREWSELHSMNRKYRDDEIKWLVKRAIVAGAAFAALIIVLVLTSPA